MIEEKEAELKVLQECIRLLAPLSPRAKARILAFVRDYFAEIDGGWAA